MANRPEELYPALTAAYNAGDLDAVVALYEPNATFVIKPGRVTATPAELRGALKFVVDLGARITVDPRSFIGQDDVVLVQGTFTLSGQRANSTPFERTSKFADVLRRQPDGRWLIAVDNPYGDA